MPVEVDTVRAVSVPTRLVHGPGAASTLTGEVGALGISRPMLVTDPGVVAAGLTERVLPQLDDVIVFDDVRPNPDIELVDRAADAYREAGCDGLVALGGGLVDRHREGDRRRRRPRGLDRAVRVGSRPDRAAHPAARGNPDDGGYRERGDAVVGHHRPRAPAEVQRRRHAADRPPRGADRPELTLGLPPAVTAATGMDALSHAIECYTCDYHQPFTDAVALHAIELVARWLRTAVGTARISRRGRRWPMPRLSGWRTGRRAPVQRMR